ncbi:MAG: selenium-dependent molybdenum cofactor biosynthesis protein YqeB [Oscillospiraceae bacterium]|nr:selenium-dependent molybdenum cofactor biosynthesis protein YqeB [Oscillospiraceae bacterium]
MRTDKLIIVRGGGDIATGTIYTLHRCGFSVLVLEAERPTAIRRQVSFSEAVYDGASLVEGMTCVFADSYERAQEIMNNGYIAMMVDEKCKTLEKVRPWALIDGILAKRNLGTNRAMAAKTIGLGPGFVAGEDVDLVIETMRGHNLGRIIEKGPAVKNTGVPGSIAGYAAERVIHAGHDGVLFNIMHIGDIVKKGQTLAVIQSGSEEFPVEATISGVLRGLIRSEFPVMKGLKIADIDPRASELANCFTISDKARCIGGSVLTALLYLERRDGV